MHTERNSSANCLAPGIQVGEYQLQGVVGEGGFGIVYQARDLSLDRIVAIKEYMPSTLAGRMASNQIHVRSQHRGAFDAGLRSFINEARLLAKFSHPALVHVYRFFEANSTAYMVMRYYEGMTFRDFLTQPPGAVDEQWLAAMLGPILDVLEMLHSADCYHRDISPDNIFLQSAGSPVLLDFGAARRIIGDLTQALTMVLKPGFAPIEQYVDDGAMPQGAWTDIYQLGAMLFLAITGKPPATSVARMINDPVLLLTPQNYPGFSARFLQGVHHALSVKPQDRPQSIVDLRVALGLNPLSLSFTQPFGSNEDEISRPVSPVVSIGVSNGVVSSSLTDRLVSSVAAVTGETSVDQVQRGSVSHLSSEFAQVGGATSSLKLAPQKSMPSVSTPFTPVAVSRRKDDFGTEFEDGARHASGKGRAWLVGAVLCAAVVFSALAIWWSRSEATRSDEATIALEPGPHQVSESTPPASPIATSALGDGTASAQAQAAPSTPASVEHPPVPVVTAPPTKAVFYDKPAATLSATKGGSGDGENSRASATATPRVVGASAATASMPAMGKVIFRIMPWGKVYVDRISKGTTPPLTEIELPEGSHKIQITNPAAASLIKMVQVKKGESVVVNHKFE